MSRFVSRAGAVLALLCRAWRRLDASGTRAIEIAATPWTSHCDLEPPHAATLCASASAVRPSRRTCHARSGWQGLPTADGNGRARRLWAVAIVIDDGEHRVGLVALDAIGLFHDDVVAIRRRVAESTALDYLIVTSTHNHSTPDLMGLWGPRAGFSGVDDGYRRRVIDPPPAAAAAAAADLAPARLSLNEIPLPTDGLVADSRRPAGVRRHAAA